MKQDITVLDHAAERLGSSGSQLLPMQELALRLMYGLPIRPEEDRKVEVCTHIMPRAIRTFTLTDYLKFLYDSGRCNRPTITYRPGNHLMIVAGQRTGKSLTLEIVQSWEARRRIGSARPLLAVYLARDYARRAAQTASPCPKGVFTSPRSEDFREAVKNTQPYKVVTADDVGYFDLEHQIEVGLLANHAEQSVLITSSGTVGTPFHEAFIRGFHTDPQADLSVVTLQGSTWELNPPTASHVEGEVRQRGPTRLVRQAFSGEFVEP